MTWLSVNEAAAELGLGRSAIYALVASGELACHRLGPSRGKIKFRMADLEAYAEKCRVGPKVKTPPAPAIEVYVPKCDRLSWRPSSRRG